MTKTDLLAKLNPEQREAVTIIDRPLKVVAGAGSGKTSVITTKIAHLIRNHDYYPSKILAVTFTNKAAREMKERVEKMVPPLPRVPWIMTFHALSLRIIRRDYSVLNLPAHFNIIDGKEQITIIKDILKVLFAGGEINQEDLEKESLKKIKEWKNEFITPDEAKKDSHNPHTDQLIKIYEAYEKKLKHNKALDLDDLLLNAVDILKKSEEALTRWQKKFKYILVDEFQDTNQIQFDLIKLLLGESQHLTVVGDADQTIYSWRGAKIKIINNFDYEFNKTKTVILKRNYRSTQEILNLANDFIAFNPHKELKKLESNNNKTGPKPQVQENLTAYYEAKFIAQEIKKLKKEFDYKNSDFFILYRSNYWSRNLEDVFFSEKLPFNLIGGIKFRERRVIKDAMAFMKVLLINDDFSMERVLKITPKIGDVTINKLRLLAKEQDTSLFNLLADDNPLVLTVSKHLKPLRETFLQVKTNVFKHSLEELAKFLLTNSGYWERIKNTDNEEHENINDLTTFLQQLKHFDQDFNPDEHDTENRLLAFLQEEALMNNEDQIQGPNKITLLTIHAAKGLENKVVFVAGLNNKVFPSMYSTMENKKIEEERRLLYVAMTRAKERLYLSYINGEYSYIIREEHRPSKFIGELNKNHFQWNNSSFVINNNEIKHELPLSEKLASFNRKVDYKRNDLVNHFALGDGVVTKVVGNEVFVAFNNPKYGVQSFPITSLVLRKK